MPPPLYYFSNSVPYRRIYPQVTGEYRLQNVFRRYGLYLQKIQTFKKRQSYYIFRTFYLELRFYSI